MYKLDPLEAFGFSKVMVSFSKANVIVELTMTADTGQYDTYPLCTKTVKIYNIDHSG